MRELSSKEPRGAALVARPVGRSSQSWSSTLPDSQRFNLPDSQRFNDDRRVDQPRRATICTTAQIEVSPGVSRERSESNMGADHSTRSRPGVQPCFLCTTSTQFEHREVICLLSEHSGSSVSTHACITPTEAVGASHKWSRRAVPARFALLRLEAIIRSQGFGFLLK